MNLPAGTTVDKYTLVRCIGQGGMGAVYEARHSLVGKRCAVKLLLPELAGKQEVVQRMLREAQAAAAIGHPNIVDTFDFGAAPDGACYLVMEYLEGRSLGDLINERGALELELAVAIVGQVLSALRAAHAKGIVHRDLKPDNIFIARSPRGGEEVKLLDFGISKFQASHHEDIQLTGTGVVLGTPYYMSPEQAEGVLEVDHRTDLWAMGVILYEVLTGEVPFQGQTFSQVIVQLMTNEPMPPRTMRPELPEAVEEVILRALEKEPAKRWSNAAELYEALLSCLPRRAESEAPMPSALTADLLDARGPAASTAGLVDAGAGTGTSLATSKTELVGATGVVVSTATGESPALDHTIAPAADLGRKSALRFLRPGRRRLLVAAGVVLALAIVAMILLLTLVGDRGERRPSVSSERPTADTPAAGGSPSAEAPPAYTPVPSTFPPRQEANQPRSSTLRIELKGLPPDAAVKLDGRRTQPPLRLRADEQRHELEVTARGYYPITKRFVARKGLATLTLRARRRRGRRRRRVARPMERSMVRAVPDIAVQDPYRMRPGPRRPAMRPDDVATDPY